MAQPTNTNTENLDDSSESTGINGFPIALLILIASPITILSAIATYLTFAKGRIRMSTIFWFILVPYLVIMLFFWEYAVASYIASWVHTIPSMVAQTLPIAEGLIQVFFQQALLSIPIGITAGLIYSLYRWHTRPVWIETEFRMTPIEWFKKQKNMRDIAADKNTPYDGMTLGIEEYGERVIQSYEESRAHTLVFGASGSGKTKVLLSRLRDSLKSGQGAVIIDLKGGTDVPDAVGELCERYDRKLQHWLFQDKATAYTGPALDGPAYYDPIGRGDATRRKDLVISSRTDWNEYYKGEASFILQLIMSTIVANPNPNVATLSDVVRLLNPITLQQRAIPLGINPIYADLVQQIDSLNDEKMEPGRKSAIKSLESMLGVLLNSTAGSWLQKDPNGNNNIDLFRAAQEGEVVVFTLDSSNYSEQAALIANLIIQDLKTLSSELRRNPAPQPFQVLIDEFSAVGSDNVLGLVNKSRDANMPVTLTTQALADLRQNSSTLQDQLLGVVNSFIILRANKEEDAKELAGLGGTIIKKRFSESVKYKTGFLSRGSAVGQGNIEDVEEYAVLPGDIQKLRAGEFYYINKNPTRIVKGRCILEDPSKVSYNNNEEKVNFIVREKQKEATTIEITDSSQIEAPPVIVPLAVPRDPHNERPIINEPSSSSQPLITPSTGIESRPANRDRLRQIMNQDPDDFSPREGKKDSYEEKLLPPAMAKPLPPIARKEIPVLGKEPVKPVEKIAPAPSFPKLPSKPVSEPIKAEPQKPTLPVFPKPGTLPAKPPVSFPKKEEIGEAKDAPNVNKNTDGNKKDQFDF